jgi:LPS-assembly lipoprotein
LKKRALTLSLCILTLISLLLVSCGFHLRGDIQLPTELKTLYLQTPSPYAAFEQSLRQSLRSYSIHLVDAKSKAPITLHIISSNVSHTATAMTLNTSTSQYTLTFTVTFELLAENGDVIVPSETTQSTTTFTSSSQQMQTSSALATQQYLPNLYQDSSFKILSRLLATNNKKLILTYFKKNKPKK